MKNIKRNEKLAYPSLILAFVLVCTALIFLQLWSNISPMLPREMTAWADELTSGVRGFIDQIIAFYDGLSSDKIPTGSSCIPTSPNGTLPGTRPPGQFYA